MELIRSLASFAHGWTTSRPTTFSSVQSSLRIVVLLPGDSLGDFKFNYCTIQQADDDSDYAVCPCVHCVCSLSPDCVDDDSSTAWLNRYTCAKLVGLKWCTHEKYGVQTAQRCPKSCNNCGAVATTAAAKATLATLPTGPHTLGTVAPRKTVRVPLGTDPVKPATLAQKTITRLPLTVPKPIIAPVSTTIALQTTPCNPEGQYYNPKTNTCAQQPTCTQYKRVPHYLSGATRTTKGVCKSCKSNDAPDAPASCGAAKFSQYVQVCDSSLFGSKHKDVYYGCPNQPDCFTELADRGNYTLPLQYLKGGNATRRGTCTDQPTCSQATGNKEYLVQASPNDKVILVALLHLPISVCWPVSDCSLRPCLCRRIRQEGCHGENTHAVPVALSFACWLIFRFVLLTRTRTRTHAHTPFRVAVFCGVECVALARSAATTFPRLSAKTGCVP